ncbi:MAG: TetR/AcrR family transcriptional regulator [Planctomycetota bacterium]
MKRSERIKSIKEQRRREILEAASDVFARNGYHLTDVDVIAGNLGVGKGTIYRYFPSKEKLFTAVMEQMMHKLAAEIAANAEGITNPVERLKTVIRSHMDFFSRHFNLLEIFVHYRSEYKGHSRTLYTRYYGRGLARVESLIQKCIDQKLMKNIPARAVTNLLIDVFYGILFTTFLGGNKQTFKEKGKYLEEVFINNLLR